MNSRYRTLVRSQHLLILLALLSLNVLGLHSAFAQQSGHYLQGSTGLENGAGLPPGFFATYLPYINQIQSLKGAAGRTLVKPDLTAVINNAIFAMSVEKKFLGAHYQFEIVFPVVNTRFTADLFNVSSQQAGLSDIYIGTSQSLQMRSQVPAGGRTRIIDLPGARRAMQSVELWYAKAKWGGVRPKVTLWGLP